jgi:tetratricopeptide (TPR) repeat protein
MQYGAYDRAESYAQEALPLCVEQGYHYIIGYWFAGRGYAAYERGAYAQARQLWQKALATFEQNGDSDVLLVHDFSGDVDMALGAYEEAGQAYGEALEGYRDIGLDWVDALGGRSTGIGHSLCRLGDVALATGDEEAAQARYQEALEMAGREPYPGLKLDALLQQAEWLAREGSAGRAAEVGALVLSHPVSLKTARDRAGALLDRARAALPAEVFEAAVARGRGRDLEGTVRELLAELDR